MALLFCDSFDHYTTVSQKWSGTGVIGAFGRNGTNGLRQQNAVPQTNAHLLGASYATLIAGFGFRPNAVGADNVQILGFHDAASLQVEVRFDASTGRLRVTRNGVTLATGATVLSNNVYYYIEFKATIHDTTGSYTLRVNTVTELTASGVDTQNSVNATADRVVLFGSGGSVFGTADWDDLYVCDTAGAQNTDFLGDIRVQAILPNAEGGNIAWTPNAGTTHNDRVNQTTPDDDTTYLSDATVGNIDSWGYGSIAPGALSIKGIQMSLYARKDDAGTRTIAPVLRIGGVNYTQADLPNLSTSYQFLSRVIELSPATAVAFTKAEVDGMEGGVKTSA